MRIIVPDEGDELKLVMKFGGTSIGDGKRIKHVANLIGKSIRKGNELVVVVSALAGVTDGLIEVTQKADSGNQKAMMDFVEKLSARHRNVAREALNEKGLLERALSGVDDLIRELERILLSVTYLKEATPRSRDYILSFGERLSTIILRAAIEAIGFEAQDLTGGEAGIITDDRFGEAIPLMNVTALMVKERLVPSLKRGEIPVVAGFIGRTQDGITTTLGRGGSDYTATILGASLNVDEVWIWTDVNGLMTADPKIEPSAKTIPRISYAEAMEMAYFGAKAMHPRALEPSVENDIPTRVKNAFAPDEEGTLIVADQQIDKETVAKAIAIIQDVALVTVSGAGMIGVPGIAASLFNILGENKINVLMISQSSSEANISFIILRRELERTVNMLELAFLGGGVVKKVSSEADVCVIAIVGAGMKGIPGVAARVFKAVAEEEINVRMIAQGSSELNISFVIKEADGIRAVRKLHGEFQLG